MPEKIGHRAVGSGATTIRVKRRTDKTASGEVNPGCFIFIGRALWQAIGSPERVSIAAESPKFYAIKPATSESGYKITNAAQDGMPRISVGGPVVAGMHLAEGTYDAVAGSMAIRFRTP